MADTPRIEKYSDSGTFVDLPGFTARAPTRSQASSFVQYEGDTRPRVYWDGDAAVDVLWSVVGVFNAHITADATALGALEDILESVHASSDRRLRMTVGGTMETHLYAAKIVCALEGGYPINQSPRGSNIYDVSMRLREVVG